MARDPDRESSETFPVLPNFLLIVVLVLLLIWGIGGLYLPDSTGTPPNRGTVLTSDTAPSNEADAALPPVSE